jgi:hypothetical protein
MQRLIAAGVLYLLGVAIVLLIQPSLMFSKDGSWKEFGIGRNQNTHTWMPFWFFAILWALSSYVIVTLVFSVYLPQKQEIHSVDFETEIKPRKARGRGIDLPDGYYIKNTEGTELAGGIPKYFYLGKALPT